MPCFIRQWQNMVNCRIGSLEIVLNYQLLYDNVNCRIGSLENKTAQITDLRKVNCRIGSLESMEIL